MMFPKLTCALAIGALSMTLAGCGAEGDEYQPRPVPAEKSVVYLYRPYKVLGTSATPIVTCGSETIEMEAGGYYAFDQESGPVTCAAASETGYKFDARPGEQYFVREDVDTIAQGGHTHFTLVRADIATDEIKDCRRQGMKK